MTLFPFRLGRKIVFVEFTVNARMPLCLPFFLAVYIWAVTRAKIEGAKVVCR